MLKTNTLRNVRHRNIAYQFLLQASYKFLYSTLAGGLFEMAGLKQPFAGVGSDIVVPNMHFF